MAKESMKAREVKRAKLVAKYAEKRKALRRREIMPPWTNCLRTQVRCVCTIAALLPDVRRVI